MIHQVPWPRWIPLWVCSATDAFAARRNRRSCQKLECRWQGCMRGVRECHRRHQHITLLMYHAQTEAFEKPPPTRALLICYVWPCRFASSLNPTIRLVADRYRDEAKPTTTGRMQWFLFSASENSALCVCIRLQVSNKASFNLMCLIYDGNMSNVCLFVVVG